LNAAAANTPHSPNLFEDAEASARGLADRLAGELDFRRDSPQLVLLGPDTDPFPANAESQQELVRVVEKLAHRGITAWLSTRRAPTADVLEALAEHRGHLRITVSLTSLDPDIQRAIEPDAVPAEERLAFIADLQRLDIPVEVNLDPLLPGLTDTHDKLWVLLEQLAERDVRQVTAGYLVLRPGVRERLQEALAPNSWSEVVLGAFHDGITFRDGPNPAAVYLSKAKRQRGYAALMALATEFDIATRLSSLANPDFRPPRQPDAASRARARALIQSLRQPERGVSAVGA
jgi:DNA repair photolyase